MQVSSLHYFPIPASYVVGLALVLGVLIVLLEIRVLRYTFAALGVHRRYVLLLLFLSLVGSAVNIPVAELPGRETISGQLVRYYGVSYVVPTVHSWPGTTIAVNVGGALVPIGLSLVLLARNRLWGRGALATALVAAFIHPMADPVRGVGIAVPVFVPALVSVAVALVLSRRHAAALAYVAGSLGTLVGADLLNLGKVGELGAPIASIGGAGSFDGIFFTGVLAVVLASWPLGLREPARDPGGNAHDTG